MQPAVPTASRPARRRRFITDPFDVGVMRQRIGGRRKLSDMFDRRRPSDRFIPKSREIRGVHPRGSPHRTGSRGRSRESLVPAPGARRDVLAQRDGFPGP